LQTLTHRAGGRPCRCARIASTGGGAPAGCRSRRQPARPAAGPPRAPAAPPWPPGAPPRPRCAGPRPRPRPPARPAPPPPPRATAPRSAAPRARVSARRVVRARGLGRSLLPGLAPLPCRAASSVARTPVRCGVHLRCAGSAAARCRLAARSSGEGPASARAQAHAPPIQGHGARPRATCRAASSSSAIAGAAAGPAAGRAGFLAAAAGRAGAGRLMFCGESACGASRSPPPACAPASPVRAGPAGDARRAPRAAGRAAARSAGVRARLGGQVDGRRAAAGAPGRPQLLQALSPRVVQLAQMLRACARRSRPPLRRHRPKA